MYKIKLLILLPISFLLISCKASIKNQNLFDIYYIGGGVDGLVYSNYFQSYLKSYSLYSKNSFYKIETSIGHNNNVYITNVDNTSDREKIDTSITVKIYDQNFDCTVLNYNDSTSQYYVISPNINFTSNNMAVEKIKQNNAEELAHNFVKYLSNINNFPCINE